MICRKHRDLTFFLILLIFLVTVVSCTYKKSPTNTSTEMIGCSSKEYSSIDEIIFDSSCIIIGTITDKSEFTTHTTKYELTVADKLKGTVDKTIDIYEPHNSLETGSTYIFFLDEWEGSLYERPVYTSIDKAYFVLII